MRDFQMGDTVRLKTGQQVKLVEHVNLGTGWMGRYVETGRPVRFVIQKDHIDTKEGG